MLGIRLERQLEARLEALAERSGKPKSYHAREAIRRYFLTDESEARRRRCEARSRQEGDWFGESSRDGRG